MSGKQKTYRTLIVLDCLGPFNAGSLDTLEALHYASKTDGDFSIVSEVVKCYEVGDAELVDLCGEHGMDPGFFGIDADVPPDGLRVDVKLVPMYRLGDGEWTRDKQDIARDMFWPAVTRKAQANPGWRPRAQWSDLMRRLERFILALHPALRE